MIRLSTFAGINLTHWSNYTLGHFNKPSPPLWKVAPDDPESLVGIFLRPDQYGGLDLTTCLISSYWWMSEASLAFVSDPPRRRMIPGIPHLISSGAPMIKSNLRPIIIDPTNISSLNSDVF